MLSEWIPQSERCVTWVSLDDGDNDPVRFWAYFIAALQMLDAEIGRNALALMRTPLLPPIEAILTILLNEIAAFPDNFALVLDDYHVIDAKPIDKALTFLLEHLPPQMHLVITTREDPNLPLARLRARDQLTELRAADLRFTPAEAAEFLNQVMGLNLSAEDIAITGNPHRRLDCGAPAGGTLDAGARGRSRVHQGFRWRQPVHRGLSGRRGLAASVRTCPELLTPDLHSRLVEWPAVRCRHRPGGRQRAVGGPGARQPVCLPAG